MLAWAVDDEPVQLWEPDAGPMPEELRVLLPDPTVIKLAWYVGFERMEFKYPLKIDIPLEQWRDIMVMARYLSLPGSLEDCGEALGLTEDQAKIKDGKRLLNIFSDANINLDDKKFTLFGLSDDWLRLREYCKRDVEAERTIFRKMEKLDLPDSEWRAWVLDQKINERGIPVNLDFAHKLLGMANRCRKEGFDEMKLKTGLENPNSTQQMLAWVKEQGYPWGSLNKSYVALELAKKDSNLTPLGREMLELRRKIVKNSISKLELLPVLASTDGRLRHQLLFMGASRTGRWSGVGVQPQNLPRPVKKVEEGPDTALRLVNEEAYDQIKLDYGSILDFCVSNLRHVFQAPVGLTTVEKEALIQKLVVCDLSAIENRVLGWVSGCNSILEVFRTCEAHLTLDCKVCPARHKKLDAYVAFAVKMYKETYEALRKQKDKRQVAKPAVLGAGFGLGPGVRRLVNRETGEVTYEVIWIINKYGDQVKTGLLGYAENMQVIMTPEQAYLAWETFRASYPEVVEFWYALENAVVRVLKQGGREELGYLSIDRVKRSTGQFILRIKLPSGRNLHYLNARLEMGEIKTKKGLMMKEQIMYDGLGHGVGMIQEGWGSVKTYGGKLTENVVQAISRDILVNGMEEADKSGAKIVLHCHDEIVCLEDADDPFGFDLADLRACMNALPKWADNRLVLDSDGYEGVYYRKG